MKTDQNKAAEAVTVVVFLPEGEFEGVFAPETSFEAISRAAAAELAIPLEEGELIGLFGEGAKALDPEQTLADAGYGKHAKLNGKRGLVNVVVVTGGENFHDHVPPDTLLSAIIERVIDECDLVIGAGETWTLKRQGTQTGLDPSHTLAQAGFQHAAVLEFSKDAYVGG